MSFKPSIGKAERAKAPIYTFTITRKDGFAEEVNSCFIEFTAHHVIFRNEEGRIDYGVHASQVIDIIQGDHV